MKIAVTYEDGIIFQHFGHTQYFKIFDVENGVIQKEQVVDTQGSGHGALVGFLIEHNVDTLLCGGIGFLFTDAFRVEECRLNVCKSGPNWF